MMRFDLAGKAALAAGVPGNEAGDGGQGTISGAGGR
jgi:hypothetical protein